MPKRILYIYRKTSRFFSIENIFNLISGEIGKRGLDPERLVVPREGCSPAVFRSNGQAVRRQKADIYHITGDVHYVSLFIPGRKTVLTIHDCGFMNQPAGVKRWLLKKLLLDWPLARCRKVTTISEHTKSQILAFTGCVPERVEVIPNPVSGLIREEPRVFDAAMPVLLFIGITPNKNLQRVIEALKGIPCILEIIGEIPPERKEELDAAGIGYRNLAGLTDEEMAQRYTESDVVLFPSLYEGFGMPIIEGQKAGRPVITSNISPMKEVAGGGACLVDPTDVNSIREGICKVVQDNVFREFVVKRGRENVRQYELEYIAGKYYTLYQEIFKEV